MKLVLEQRQMLKTVMTKELRQAIELLQLSTYDLFQYIQKQAEENPFIELNNQEDTYLMQKNSRRKVSRQGVSSPELIMKSEKSMYDYLLEQIITFPLKENEKKLVQFLILNINERGYLDVTDEEIFEQFDINEIELMRAKKWLHQLEPKGIGASNLVECLEIQAKVRYPNDTLLQTVIKQYLNDVADGKWQKIANELNVPLVKIEKTIERLKTLNPRPGNALRTTKEQYVAPDISIKRDKKLKRFKIQLNDYYLPKMEFNKQYANEMMISKKLSNYVQEHIRKYDWLMKSIEQRRTTILKIMNVIVDYQYSFLQHGFRSLKPLTLQYVADQINMHESTVSRATANKMIETPVGTFELRRLFSTKIATQSGGSVSQTKVKTLLQELIEHEEKVKPLSDQKIAEQLNERGIVISRRTVAKYRDELRIPSSTKRKIVTI